MNTLLKVLGIILLAGIILGGACIACFHDDDDDPNSLGLTHNRIILVSHYDDGDDDGYGNGADGGSYGNGNDQRRRCEEGAQCRGSFSPGPFDRSPIDFSGSCISLNCSGRDRDREERMRAAGTPVGPASLFPPTPAGIRDFVVNTTRAGLDLGQAFADLTIKFVGDLLIGIA